MIVPQPVQPRSHVPRWTLTRRSWLELTRPTVVVSNFHRLSFAASTQSPASVNVHKAAVFACTKLTRHVCA